MADQPNEVAVVSQTTPGHTSLTDTTGARSVYDPSPQDTSAAAFANALGQASSGVDNDSGSGPSVSGVSRTVTQTPGLPPVVFHTAGVSYEIPLGGPTPPRP